MQIVVEFLYNSKNMTFFFVLLEFTLTGYNRCIGKVKEKLEQLPCEQFLQVFEISRSFLRAK